jgi:hypothetical protein
VLGSQGRHRPIISEETRPGAFVVPGIDDDGGYEEQTTVATNEEAATVVTSEEETTVRIFARVVDTDEENRRLCEQERVLRERDELLQERNRLLQMIDSAVVADPVVINDRDEENGNEPIAGQNVENKESDLLNQCDNVLHAWKDVYKVEKENADAAYYYAKQLWCEDMAKWAHWKSKALRGEWTVRQFDQVMKILKNKQGPVWDILIKKVDGICKNLEGPRGDVKATHERLKKSLGPHPLMKLVGKKIDRSADHVNLRHEYQCRLFRQYKDAETEFQLLCAWPDGTLTRVKSLRENYLKENTRIIEYVHNQKGLLS